MLDHFCIQYTGIGKMPLILGHENKTHCLHLVLIDYSTNSILVNFLTFIGLYNIKAQNKAFFLSHLLWFVNHINMPEACFEKGRKHLFML